MFPEVGDATLVDPIPIYMSPLRSRRSHVLFGDLGVPNEKTMCIHLSAARINSYNCDSTGPGARRATQPFISSYMTED